MIADDLTYRAIHALNNPEVHTPNLDRLTADGCAFTHCFHQGSWMPAVCMPSRTMLLTGLTAFRARTECDSTPLWGQTLRNAGYHCYMVGKWHLDEIMLGRSFEEIGPVAPAMFESTPEGGDAYGRPRANDTWTPWDTSLKGQWLHTSLWQNSAEDTIRHSAAVWADCAADHLVNKVPRLNQPFFMYIGFNSPHDPRQSPKEFVDMFPQEKMEIPPNYLPEFPFDNGYGRQRDEQLAPFPRTREAVQLHRSEYYAHIAYLDKQVGRILDALARSGRGDNTYVIFTSDHGLAVGQHGLMGKQNMYDHSIRMPWIITGPGVPKGKRVDDLIYQHCTFATTCELAAVPVPKSVEFPSIVGLIKGHGAPRYDAVFSRYMDFQRAVRTKEHKLVLYPHVKKAQLFDLYQDPWEVQNLVDRPEMAAVRESLRQRLFRFQEELGDPLDLRQHAQEWRAP